MLRPHTFTQFNPAAVTFVRQNDICVPGVPETKLFNKQARDLLSDPTVLGFYFEFKSKTMPHARAYLPNLSHPRCHYSAMCPLAALRTFAEGEDIKPGFLKKAGTGKKLKEYLQSIMNNEASISPYALRIGGRTWYISQGLDRQFVDYLGTWSSPEASARYFRARPAAVLRKCRQFYYNQRDPRAL